MNESVFAMINTLKARLNDLQIAVENCPAELAGYDKKLDKIDDQVYLLVVEVEKRTAALKENENLPQFNVVHGSPAQEKASNQESANEQEAAGENQVAGEDGAAGTQASETSAPEASQGEGASSDGGQEKKVLKGGIFTEDYELTPKAKETIGNAAQTFGSFLKDAKEVTSEFSGLKKDLDETFDFLPRGKRRR